jgi:hypothetical protein
VALWPPLADRCRDHNWATQLRPAESFPPAFLLTPTRRSFVREASLRHDAPQERGFATPPMANIEFERIPICLARSSSRYPIEEKNVHPESAQSAQSGWKPRISSVLSTFHHGGTDLTSHAHTPHYGACYAAAESCVEGVGLRFEVTKVWLVIRRRRD